MVFFIITLKHVTKVYPSGVYALRNVDLHIDEGEFVFLLGQSGAGKSTFLRLLLAEELPTEGTITVGDYVIPGIRRRQIPFYRRTIGVVFQDFRLIDSKTVFDNIAFSLWVAGAARSEIRKRVLEVLDLVGLSDKARRCPQELSGGEQQRVAIARAMVGRPRILFADEPTGNIDPQLAFEIIDLFHEINRRGTTVLLVTHAHDIVAKFSDRIVIVERGEIAADSKMEVPV